MSGPKMSTAMAELEKYAFEQKDILTRNEYKAFLDGVTKALSAASRLMTER